MLMSNDINSQLVLKALNTVRGLKRTVPSVHVVRHALIVCDLMALTSEESRFVLTVIHQECEDRRLRQQTKLKQGEYRHDTSKVRTAQKWTSAPSSVALDSN
jgi:hypothetical protein